LRRLPEDRHAIPRAASQVVAWAGQPPGRDLPRPPEPPSQPPCGRRNENGRRRERRRPSCFASA